MLLGNLGLLRQDPMAFAEVLLATAIGLLIAITFHEVSHGLAAAALGDDTARRQGRLSLNPLVHLEPVGAILLFLVGFGWGKPVPVNPYNLRGGERRGMALVALAGPASNLLLAAIFALPLRFNAEIAPLLLSMIILLNLLLAVFNLLPIPPLDGYRIAVGLLPRAAAFPLSRLETYGPALLIGVLLLDSLSGVSLLGRVMWPVINLFSRLFAGGSFLG